MLKFRKLYYRYLKGQKIGIVGPSASKINFIKYTTRFLQPSMEKILIDDQDNCDIQNCIRIGIFSEIYLLDDTILKNVALVEINEDVTYKVEKSLKMQRFMILLKTFSSINTNVSRRCKIFWWSETKNWNSKSIIPRS